MIEEKYCCVVEQPPKQVNQCVYTDDLINKIKFINQTSCVQVDLKAIHKAIDYAKRYHSQQFRQSGDPYYSHPLIVATMLVDYIFDEDMIITAILHDVLEDTDITKEILVREFGIAIYNNIESLTRIKPNAKISSADIIKQLWLDNRQDLLLIKYFDRVHNLQTIQFKSEKKRKKIINETLIQFVSLSIYFEKNNIPDLISDECVNIVQLCAQLCGGKKIKNYSIASVEQRLFDIFLRCWQGIVNINRSIMRNLIILNIIKRLGRV